MKKLLFGLIATVMIGMSVNANSFAKEIQCMYGSETVENAKPKIVIHIEWGRKSKGCVGFGICYITIAIDLDVDLSDWSFKGGATTDGKLSVDISAAEMQNVGKRFGSDTIKVEEDFRLSDETCRSLELRTGYIVKAGSYRAMRTSTGDYTVVL